MMRAAEFEARYRADPDPWGYRTSAYERAKYAATLEACGPGRFNRALELGGSIGVFSELLAPRCRSLTTLDFAPSAVREASARLTGLPHVSVRLATIPDGIPAQRFDCIVASEVLYYLSAAAFERTLGALDRALAPSGRLVCVHWRPGGPERPLDAAGVHAALAARSWLAPRVSASTDSYLLDAWQRI